MWRWLLHIVYVLSFFVYFYFHWLFSLIYWLLPTKSMPILELCWCTLQRGYLLPYWAKWDVPKFFQLESLQLGWRIHQQFLRSIELHSSSAPKLGSYGDPLLELLRQNQYNVEDATYFLFLIWAQKCAMLLPEIFIISTSLCSDMLHFALMLHWMLCKVTLPVLWTSFQLSRKLIQRLLIWFYYCTVNEFLFSEDFSSSTWLTD